MSPKGGIKNAKRPISV